MLKKAALFVLWLGIGLIVGAWAAQRFGLNALAAAIHIDKIPAALALSGEICGWRPCNCRPPDVSGGPVHCDLCPILCR